MKLTNDMIRRLMALQPGNTGERIVLDRRGSHHKTIPAMGNFPIQSLTIRGPQAGSPLGVTR